MKNHIFSSSELGCFIVFLNPLQNYSISSHMVWVSWSPILGFFSSNIALQKYTCVLNFRVSQVSLWSTNMSKRVKLIVYLQSHHCTNTPGGHLYRLVSSTMTAKKKEFRLLRCTMQSGSEDMIELNNMSIVYVRMTGILYSDRHHRYPTLMLPTQRLR